MTKSQNDEHVDLTNTHLYPVVPFEILSNLSTAAAHVQLVLQQVIPVPVLLEVETACELRDTARIALRLST